MYYEFKVVGPKLKSYMHTEKCLSFTFCTAKKQDNFLTILPLVVYEGLDRYIAVNVEFSVCLVVIEAMLSILKNLVKLCTIDTLMITQYFCHFEPLQ